VPGCTVLLPSNRKRHEKLSTAAYGPDPAVDVIITKPTWLYMAVHADIAVVYRSVLVKDTDELYKEVIQQLDGYTLLHSRVVPDKDMMFGKAEESWWITAASAS
jgi:hypothetical protein